LIVVARKWHVLRLILKRLVGVRSIQSRSFCPLSGRMRVRLPFGAIAALQ
jgi:hypothetical protein